MKSYKKKRKSTLTKPKKTDIKSTADRYRLSIFRSNLHIFAQIIDDVKGETLVSASSLKLSGSGGNVAAATEVGKVLAEQAKAKKITKVIFDRGRYQFKGRIKALAASAADNGLII